MEDKKNFELIKLFNDILIGIGYSFFCIHKVTRNWFMGQNFQISNTEKGFELINTIQGHTNRICSVSFSADGKYLTTGSCDKPCKICSAEKGFEVINTIQGHNDKICYVAFSAD